MRFYKLLILPVLMISVNCFALGPGVEPIGVESFSNTSFWGSGYLCKKAPCAGGKSNLRDDGTKAATSGQCYRCNYGPDAHECAEGTVIGIKDDRDHANPMRMKALWYCDDKSPRNDEWVLYNPGDNMVCEDSPFSVGEFDENTMDKWILALSSKSGKKTGAVKDGTGDNIIWSEGTDGCWMIECKKGFKQSGDKCVPGTDPEPDPKPGPDQKKKGGGSGSGGSSCLNRPTAEGRACCRAKGATKWKDNVCTCVDTTKEWKYTEGQEYGQCVAKGSTEVVNPCDAICTNYVSIVVDNCAMQKVNNYANVITQITQQCSNRTNCNPGTVGQLVNQIEVAVASCASQPKKPEINKQRLAEAITAIDKYRSGLDVSVWKDAEGNFNTARLVSDSIAGVVLGTAGGLITSSVVKKNQVKNGFEDVVCTIGGQTVGSYGDEISVGIK